MRRFRPWIVLLLALASGVSAAYLALRYLRQQTAPLMAAEPKRGEVVLAARDLPVGHVIGESDVKVVSWPGDAVPIGFIGSPAAAVGRGVITAVKLNEAMLDTKLATKDGGGGLPITISEGMRALSVRVDEVIGVAGFVLPGTRVDVLLTLGSGQGRSETTTRIVLQNVAVLAAGQQVERDKDGKPQMVAVITLLVTPEQAETLTLAANDGRIQLALRNTIDTLRVATEGAQTGSLLALHKQAPRVVRGPRVAVPAPKGPEPIIIEGYRGGERTLIKF
jgi:pilus assembly protein CpaB